MIIWSGLGFLVAVVTFGSCLLFNYVLDSQFGEGYYSSHAWASGLAVFLGGAASALIGFLLKGRASEPTYDQVTGEQTYAGDSSHSFFFIPMHWAGVAIAVVGIYMVISGLLS